MTQHPAPPAAAPRTVLAVPAAREDFLSSARRRAADALMIDLEDGIAPEAREAGREILGGFLRDPAPRPPVWVRVNELGSSDFEQDLAAVEPYGDRVAALVLPKATTAAVEGASRATSLPVVALVETAAGVEQAAALAGVPGVAGLMFGSVDYAADVSRHGGWHLEDLSWTESRIVNAAAAHGHWSIAGPCTDIAGPDSLAAAVESDRRRGFAGKLCIHPGQLDEVNAGFGPSTAQLEWAHQVLEATDGRDVGAVRVAGRMVDRPLIEHAHRLVAAEERTAR